MEYCNKISYNQAWVLYDEGKTVYVKYQSTNLDIETAMFNKNISCFKSLPEGIYHLFASGKASIILEYSYTIYIDTDSAIEKAMKTKLNLIYGRSINMKLTHDRFMAVETASTLIRSLRKGVLEPNEPFVLAACEQIAKDHYTGKIDGKLYAEIADIINGLGCQYKFWCY